MKRRIRYQVAASLDGYIAGPNGDADWILIDPDIDFQQISARYDATLMGRRTYEWMLRFGGEFMPEGAIYVASGTLQQADHARVTVVADAIEKARQLRESEGKDIWLFGGGSLFRSLAGAGLVDTVEVAVIPVLLGGGVPLYPAPAERMRLRLEGHKAYPKTGTMLLEYAVD